jgi:predicted nucleotidyltransferase
MSRDDVLTTLHEHDRELREKYGVQSLSLFGSVARDEARSDSDVALLVEFNRPVGLFGLVALQKRLERLFGCKVDLGTPNSLRPGLREKVLQEAIHVA